MKFTNGFKLTSKASRRLPTEYFVLADVAFEGAVIGYLAGRPIREAVTDRDGLRYRFVGVAPRLPGGGFDVLALRSGEWIVLPGLVYAADAKESATPNEADRRLTAAYRLTVHSARSKASLSSLSQRFSSPRVEHCDYLPLAVKSLRPGDDFGLDRLCSESTGNFGRNVVEDVRKHLRLQQVFVGPDLDQNDAKHAQYRFLRPATFLHRLAHRQPPHPPIRSWSDSSTPTSCAVAADPAMSL